LWSVSKAKPLWVDTKTSLLRPLGFFGDNKFALLQGESRLEVWDVQQGRRIRVFAEKSIGNWRAGLSQNGRLVLFRGKDGELQLWDVEKESLLRKFKGYIPSVRRLVFSADDRRVFSDFGAVGDEINSMVLWEVSTGQRVREFPSDEYWGSPVAFSPDGKLALASRWEKHTHKDYLTIWRLIDGKEIVRIPAEAGETVFTPDGKGLVGQTHVSHNLTRWDVMSGKVNWSIELDHAAVDALAFAPGARWVLSCAGSDAPGSDDTISVKVWDAPKGKLVRVLSGPG
jgi:WD40 repeat protein